MALSAGVLPPPKTILVTRLDGLGDAVLATPLLAGLHQQWPKAAIKLLVRPQMLSVREILPDWVNVIPLGFDLYQPMLGQEEALAQQIRQACLAARAELVVLGEYNRVWVSEVMAMMLAPARVVAFDSQSGLSVMNRKVRDLLKLPPGPTGWQLVPAAYEWREPKKYHAMLASLGIVAALAAPTVHLREQDRAAARALWNEWNLPIGQTVLLFPGSGEGLKRSLSASTWARWAEHLSARHTVALLGSSADGATFGAIEAAGLPAQIKQLSLPPERAGMLAGVLELAGAYIGADTGPMHICAALGRPTLGVFGGGTMGRCDSGHEPQRFLPVGDRAAAVRMPLGCYGCGWYCAFDERFCLTRMPAEGLIKAGDEFLQFYLANQTNADAFSIHVFDLAPPPELPALLLGPIMRQHQSFLRLNHEIIEHHDYLARVLSDMTKQNEARDQAIAKINNVLAEMTQQNQARDQAISQLSKRKW